MKSLLIFIVAIVAVMSLDAAAQDSLFSSPVNYPITGSPFAICLNDFDMDGDKDIAVANNTGQSLAILLNDGHGVFASATYIPGGEQSNSILSADFDGDQDFDLAAINLATNDISV